jgi:hypothetical protein
MKFVSCCMAFMTVQRLTSSGLAAVVQAASQAVSTTSMVFARIYKHPSIILYWRQPQVWVPNTCLSLKSDSVTRGKMDNEKLFVMKSFNMQAQHSKLCVYYRVYLKCLDCKGDNFASKQRKTFMYMYIFNIILSSVCITGHQRLRCTETASVV